MPAGEEPSLPLTAWAVLGVLAFPGERSGYEIKSWADRSLRFFYWSPALSQVYRELRRLEDIGYVTASLAPQDCIDYVQRLVDAGADEIMFLIQMGTVPQEICLETIRNIGTYVLPHFRAQAEAGSVKASSGS